MMKGYSFIKNNMNTQNNKKRAATNSFSKKLLQKKRENATLIAHRNIDSNNVQKQNLPYKQK